MTAIVKTIAYEGVSSEGKVYRVGIEVGGFEKRYAIIADTTRIGAFHSDREFSDDFLASDMRIGFAVMELVGRYDSGEKIELPTHPSHSAGKSRLIPRRAEGWRG